MVDTIYILALNLQLFAEGTGGADGGTGAGDTGVNASAAEMQTTKGVKNANPLANVKYGIQDDSSGEGAEQTADAQKADTVSTEDRASRFEALIKGEFKDLYDARVQDTVQKRLKGSKDTVEKYNSLMPTIEMLAKKYGVDAQDIEGINKAIVEDDAYYEEEALEKGITVQQLKDIKKMERENSELKKQMNEQRARENADRLYASWMEQAKGAKSVYPSFDLKTELSNPQFVNLVRNNVDVRTAYEVIHKDEIIPAAMQFTAKTVEQKLTNKIMSGGRPSENGTSGQSASLVKSNVSQLSKEDRAEIIRRVQRGEKIRF